MARRETEPPEALPAASDRVRREWLRRVEAEYRSAAFTQHFTLWLIQIGAPPDLLTDGLRIVGDELIHAELSHTVFADAGGVGTPHLHRETLGLLRRESVPLEVDVLRVTVDVFCLGETVAVRLFKRLRAGCKVPSARRALDRILRDEVRHRDFGWTTLEWLLQTPLETSLREALGRELPAQLARLQRNYGGIAGTAETARDALEFPESERAWGLMPVSEYVAAVGETIERDYAPRFERLGIAMPR